MNLLGRIMFAVPNAVVFICDFNNRRPSPEWDGPEQVVAAGSVEAIQISVVHGQVGLADIRVGWGEPSAGLTAAYEGGLDLEFGQLMVTDVDDENALVIGVEPGRRTVRVFIDSAPWPSTIEILIDQP
ncbi:hypothetical protein GCM10009827_055510 [Dactylosporangium maewongense]|uniref:Uncharacterized protein n=1 Tax=Dactylosporangium maewongense TaxID=634393 RepID=A0ABN2B2Q0_9ACTN